MHRLSGLDAQFLAAEHGNSGSHYCGLAIYQTGDQKPITAATIIVAIILLYVALRSMWAAVRP